MSSSAVTRHPFRAKKLRAEFALIHELRESASTNRDWPPPTKNFCFTQLLTKFSFRSWDPSIQASAGVIRMMNIFAHYWGWLLLITVIGFVGGMIVHPDEEDTGLPVWFWPLALLLVLGVVAGKFGFVGSPYSAWTEFAAIAFTGFSLGALAGGFGKKFGLRWGPLLVSALVGAIAMFMTPVSGWMVAEKAAPAAAEAPAASAAADAAKPAEAAPAEAKSGEAVTAAASASADPFAAKPAATTPAPDADAAAKAEEDAKAAAAAKAEDEAKAAAAAKAEEDAKAAAAAKAEDDAKAAAAAKAEEDAKAAAAAKAEDDAKAAAAKAEENAKAAAPAPLTVAALAEQKSSAIAAAKALPAKGPLDGAQCQTALSGLTAKEDIKFDTNSAKVSKPSMALISKIGAILGRCPAGVSMEIAGHTDSSGDAAKNKTLSQNRAEAVLKLLKAKAKGDHLTAVGYGVEKPLASNDTAEGKAANRRIEFSVK